MTTREDKCLKSNEIHFRRQLRLISGSVFALPILLFNTRVESNYLTGGKKMLQLLNKLRIPLVKLPPSQLQKHYYSSEDRINAIWWVCLRKAVESEHLEIY